MTAPTLALASAIVRPSTPPIAAELLAALPAHTYVTQVGPLWGATWTTTAGAWTVHHEERGHHAPATQIDGRSVHVLLQAATAGQMIAILRLFGAIEPAEASAEPAKQEAAPMPGPDPQAVPTQRGLATGGVIKPVTIGSPAGDAVEKIAFEAAARMAGGADHRS